MKLCSNCLRTKMESDFGKDKRNDDGLQYICKHCSNEYKKEYYLANREIIRAKQAEYSRKNPRKEQTKKWKAENRDRYTDSLLRRKYKISLIDYNTMLNKQKDCCKICKRHKSEFKKSLCVDHSHKTGRVRGLLCSFCNTAIGLLGDSTTILKSALKYLNKENLDV